MTTRRRPSSAVSSSFRINSHPVSIVAALRQPVWATRLATRRSAGRRLEIELRRSSAAFGRVAASPAFARSGLPRSDLCRSSRPTAWPAVSTPTWAARRARSPARRGGSRPSRRLRSSARASSRSRNSIASLEALAVEPGRAIVLVHADRAAEPVVAQQLGAAGARCRGRALVRERCHGRAQRDQIRVKPDAFDEPLVDPAATRHVRPSIARASAAIDGAGATRIGRASTLDVRRDCRLGRPTSSARPRHRAAAHRRARSASWSGCELELAHRVVERRHAAAAQPRRRAGRSVPSASCTSAISAKTCVLYASRARGTALLGELASASAGSSSPRAPVAHDERIVRAAARAPSPRASDRPVTAAVRIQPAVVGIAVVVDDQRALVRRAGWSRRRRPR